MQLRRLVIGEANRLPELARLYYEHAPLRTLAALTDAFARLHDRGVLNAPEPSLAAEHFAFLIVGQADRPGPVRRCAPGVGRLRCRRLRPGRRRRIPRRIPAAVGPAGDRLRRRGRRGRIARRGAGAGRIRVADDAGPAVVDEHSRRRATDPDLPNPRHGGHCRRQQRNRVAGRGRRRAHPGHRALPLRRRSRYRTHDRHPSRQPLHHAVRRRPSLRDVARGTDVGQQRERVDRDRSSARTRGRARSAPDCSMRCRPCWCCVHTSGTPR